MNISLGGDFKYFFFHPYLGKWSNFPSVFQIGWNHQLVYHKSFMLFFSKNGKFQLPKRQHIFKMLPFLERAFSVFLISNTHLDLLLFLGALFFSTNAYWVVWDSRDTLFITIPFIFGDPSESKPPTAPNHQLIITWKVSNLKKIHPRKLT